MNEINITTLLYEFLDQDNPLNNYIRELYEEEIEYLADNDESEPHPVLCALILRVVILEILSKAFGHMTALTLVEGLKMNMLS